MKTYWYNKLKRSELILFFFHIILCIGIPNAYTSSPAFRNLKNYKKDPIRNSNAQRIHSFLPDSNRAMDRDIRLQENSNPSEFNRTASGR